MTHTKTEGLRLSNEESNRITKECLQSALVQLMNEKKLEEITITELVKLSGVSRTAFYRNYTAKEDILAEISDRIYEEIRSSLNNPYYIQNPRALLVDYFTMAKEKERMLTVLLQANIKESLPKTSSYLAQMFPSEDAATQYMILALEGAFSSVFRHWLMSGAKETPEEMADICIQILVSEPSI